MAGVLFRTDEGIFCRAQQGTCRPDVEDGWTQGRAQARAGKPEIETRSAGGKNSSPQEEVQTCSRWAGQRQTREENQEQGGPGQVTRVTRRRYCGSDCAPSSAPRVNEARHGNARGQHRG